MILRHHNFRILHIALLLMSLPALLIACDTKKSGAPQRKDAAPVMTAAAVKKVLPVQITAIGNVEAYSTVAIKAQMGGFLSRIHFREGDDVAKGAVLFTLDSRTYEAQLKQAEATLARDMAQLENATVEMKRYEDLAAKGFVAQSEYDKIRTNAAVLDATVKADKAAIENARLNVGYCTIRSPIDGKTGSLIVHEGDLIKANADTAMLVINQIQPVYVTFAVPESYLPEIKKYAGAITVDVSMQGDTHKAERGKLAFIDNTVDTATGTIRLKALFTNTARRLWPGQFVTAVITLSVKHDAVVIPSQAVQTGQAGSYVYVVKQDRTVELRPVTVTRAAEGHASVEKGVNAGETVVIDGQMRLTPGAAVDIKNEKKSEQEKSR